MPNTESGKQLPQGSLDQLVDFFDNHDMGDYLEDMPEVQFEVDIRRRRNLVEIDEGLLGELVRIAREKRISAEQLIHTWLQERVAGIA